MIKIGQKTIKVAAPRIKNVKKNEIRIKVPLQRTSIPAAMVSLLNFSN